MPDNVDYRLKKAFEIMREVNRREPADRADYVRRFVAPLVPNLNEPKLKGALAKFCLRATG